MKNTIFYLCLVAVTTSANSVNADQSLIRELRQAEARYGMPDMSLVALSKTESSLNWFAINFDDGASFYPDTKEQALRIIRNVSQRPYIVRASTNGGTPQVYFFQTLAAAQSAVASANRTDGYRVEPHPDGSVVRKLNLLNTGLCAMQLNFRWQAYKQGRSAKTLLDPKFCIDHAAKFVSGLIKKHGFEKGIGCYYTCGNEAEARRNRAEYFARYSRHFKRLSKSTSLAQR